MNTIRVGIQVACVHEIFPLHGDAQRAPLAGKSAWSGTTLEIFTIGAAISFFKENSKPAQPRDYVVILPRMRHIPPTTCVDRSETGSLNSRMKHGLLP